MRGVGAGDLDACVRVLLARPESEWPGVARRLIVEAHAADKCRKRTGRGHWLWGNGSLSSVAQGWRNRTLPPFVTGRRAEAMAVMLAALAEWRADRGRVSRVRRRHNEAGLDRP